MRSHWITHKDRRILYSDYTGFMDADFDALMAELRAVEEEIMRHTEYSVLLITDIRGSVASREAVDAFKKSAARSRKFVWKNAVIGVTGIKKIMFEAVVRFSGQPARTFEDIEAAKDWLAQAD
jgi:hypothetical protein